MGLIAEHDGALHGYETVQFPAADEAGRRSAAMLRRRSARVTKRAVLYLHCLADSFVPEDLASWYTERGFHFYVADLRPQAQLDKPASRRRGPADLGDCFRALDAMSAYLRDCEAIDTVVVSAHAAGALIAALWCHARRAAGPADALILAGPAFGNGRRKRISRRLGTAGAAATPGGAAPPQGMLPRAQRQLRSGLDIACPVLVMCTAADWDAPDDRRRRRQGLSRPGGGHGTIRLGPHVTWLRLADELTGPLPPGGPESTPFFRELGRWLGAYLSGQFRDQLL
jgi:Serine aminopeptidase, S33